MSVSAYYQSRDKHYPSNFDIDRFIGSKVITILKIIRGLNSPGFFFGTVTPKPEFYQRIVEKAPHCTKTRRLSHQRRWWSGVCEWWGKTKNTKKSHRRVISHHMPGRSSWADLHQTWHVCWSCRRSDVCQVWYPFGEGFVFWWGQSLLLAIGKL